MTPPRKAAPKKARRTTAVEKIPSTPPPSNVDQETTEGGPEAASQFPALEEKAAVSVTCRPYYDLG